MTVRVFKAGWGSGVIYVTANEAVAYVLQMFFLFFVRLQKI